MNKDQLLAAIHSNSSVQDENLKGLNVWIEEFPYFTAARLLHLKSIQFSNPLTFPLEVKKCAAHIGDRERMYALTHQNLAQPIPDLAKTQSESPHNLAVIRTEVSKETLKEEAKNQPEIGTEKLSAKEKVKRILEENKKMRLALEKDQTKIQTTPEKIETESTIEKAKPVKVAEKKNPVEEQNQIQIKGVNPLTEKVLPISTSTEDFHSESLEVTVKIEEVILPTAVSSEPEVFVELPLVEKVEETAENLLEKNEKDSIKEESNGSTNRISASSEVKKHFSHWLKEMQAQEKKVEKSPIARQKKIIDTFLEKLPGIKPDKAALKRNDHRDFVQQSLSENREMVTETLAKLYLEQGHLTKALDAFEILLLRFPEKSSFFAAQTREIRKSLKEKGKK